MAGLTCNSIYSLSCEDRLFERDRLDSGSRSFISEEEPSKEINFMTCRCLFPWLFDVP